MRAVTSDSSDPRVALRTVRELLVPGQADLFRLLGGGAVEAGAEGAEVRLSNGRTAIDFGSYAVTLLGHRHPSVVSAVSAALESQPTSTRVLANPTVASFARALVDAFDPERLRRVVVGLNGSDVVEAATKLAMAATGLPKLLAVDGGFHGKTLGALALTADGERRRPFEPLLGHVRHIPIEAGAVADALDTEPAAALVVEPIQGEGGGRVIPRDVLRRWAADARSRGAFIIVDEIQVGLRRCGPMSVALDAGVEPDALLLGKPLGGGVMPLSAMIGTEELFRPLAEDPFFHTATFGGHPASCAAGIAALDVIQGGDEQVQRVASALVNALDVIGSSHAPLLSTRSFGLFGVLECATVEAAQLLAMECARSGLLLTPCLTAPHVLRVLPPMVATDDQLERGFGVLDAAATSVAMRLVRTRPSGRSQ